VLRSEQGPWRKMDGLVLVLVLEAESGTAAGDGDVPEVVAIVLGIAWVMWCCCEG
jgi:hypothetical protein